MIMRGESSSNGSAGIGVIGRGVEGIGLPIRRFGAQAQKRFIGPAEVVKKFRS